MNLWVSPAVQATAPLGPSSFVPLSDPSSPPTVDQEAGRVAASVPGGEKLLKRLQVPERLEVEVPVEPYRERLPTRERFS